ncbi:MAG: outer membrane lipoprotein chaperone LolA [Rhodanobacteraceae bacterium]
MRLLLAGCCLLYGTAFAATASAADSARGRMQAFSDGLKTVSAHFSQSVTDANGHRGDQSSGSFALKAPRLLRWQTTAPYQQLIVADGTHVWVYDPDLEQVTVRRQDAEEAHSPLSVLTDLSLLDRQFNTAEEGDRDGLMWLKLTSKASDPAFEYAELGFDAQALERMLFKDQLGNTTEIKFSDWKRNPQLAADTFVFTPPKGVDVVGDMSPDAEIHPLKGGGS